MRVDDPRHGTGAGYQRHRKDGEEACAPCREAVRAAAAKRRRENPASYSRERAGMRASSRALWRLADLHRDEYDRLYADELRAEHVRDAS